MYKISEERYLQVQNASQRKRVQSWQNGRGRKIKIVGDIFKSLMPSITANPLLNF